MQRLYSSYLSRMSRIGGGGNRIGGALYLSIFDIFSLLYSHAKTLLELLSIVADCI